MVNYHNYFSLPLNQISGVGIHWAKETRFTKDKELNKELINEEIEEAVSEENYEKAALLRDKLKLVEN